MAQTDLLPRFALDGQFHPTCKILAEIVKQIAVGGGELLLYRQAQNTAHRLIFLSDQGFKAIVIGFCATHTGKGQRGILALAVIEFGETDRAGENRPTFIRSQDFFGAIGICQHHHSQQGGGIAVKIGCRIETQSTFIPAVPQGDSQFILPLQGMQFISLILQPLVIAGPARGKISIIQFCSVQFRFIQAQGSCVQPGFCDGL